METRKKRRARLFGKWFCYSCVLVLGGVLQTTPGFLTIGNVKPVFILPVCLAVAVAEGAWAGAVFGAVGGLLWDLTAGRTAGLMATGVLLLCFGAAILLELYLRANRTNFLLLAGVGCLAILSLDFLFSYLMRGYARPAERFLSVVLPTSVFTAAVSPLAWWFVLRVAARFAPKE